MLIRYLVWLIKKFFSLSHFDILKIVAIIKLFVIGNVYHTSTLKVLRWDIIISNSLVYKIPKIINMHQRIYRYSTNYQKIHYLPSNLTWKLVLYEGTFILRSFAFTLVFKAISYNFQPKFTFNEWSSVLIIWWKLMSKISSVTFRSTKSKETYYSIKFMIQRL